MRPAPELVTLDDMQNASALVAATPAARDRYIDLLRVSSLGVVVLGHWLMAVVLIHDDGAVTATNVLSLQPWLQPLTWALQVMPVFFFVGGFSHAVAWASLRRRAGGYADFVASRANRLLHPTALFIVVWLAIALAVELSGHDEGVLRLATSTVAQPLWFVGVYLGMVALAPAMLRLHRALGRRAAAAPLALAATAGAVDVARFLGEVPYVAYLNVALVWCAAHQLGFLYADGTLQRGGRRLALTLAGTGLAATTALTAFGPYPTSMVGMPGDAISNMSPPTLALVAQATFLIGVVLWLREPASRWLRHRHVWRYVIVANGLAMTAFLWHLTAMFAATAASTGLGLTQPAPGSAAWWLLRPVWIAVLVAFTTMLILAFRNADRPQPPRDPAPARAWRTPAAAAGMTACLVGVLGFSAVGFGGLLASRTATLVVLPVTPLWSAVALTAGALLLHVSTRGRRGTRADEPDPPRGWSAPRLPA